MRSSSRRCSCTNNERGHLLGRFSRFWTLWAWPMGALVSASTSTFTQFLCPATSTSFVMIRGVQKESCRDALSHTPYSSMCTRMMPAGSRSKLDSGILLGTEIVARYVFCILSVALSFESMLCEVRISWSRFEHNYLLGSSFCPRMTQLGCLFTGVY